MPIQKLQLGRFWFFLICLFFSSLLPFSFVQADHIALPGPDELSFQDTNTIVDGDSRSYTRQSETLFRASTGSGGSPACFHEIRNVTAPANAGQPATATFVAMDINSSGTACIDHDSVNVSISNAAAAFPDLPPGETEEAIPSCTTNGGPLAWLACPMSTLLLNAIQTLADLMNTLLQVQPLQTDGSVYTVWSNVRNIALGVFVILVLVVIFGQTLSIDAYTVKRMAPRLGIAAIGIMLSFYIAAFAIDLFNVLGQGMYRLLVGTLGEQEIGTTAGGVAAEWLTGGALVAGGAIAIVSSGAFAFFIMILVPVLMAMLTGFIVVLARQVILILLVLVAPIALAMWTLPNTEQYFKRWRGLFSSLLMMYPIIMILLASGSIFAVIVTSGEKTITESNFLNQVIALMALGFTVGLIPLTLKASSSLLGRIASTVNDPNRGPIDRLRKAGQARGDFIRDARRQERLNQLGKLDKGNVGGLKKSLQRGYLRTMTGTTGYSKYADLQESEAVTGARTATERTDLARERAKKERGDIADFQLQQDVKSWAADKQWDQGRIKQELEGLAGTENPDTVQRTAALRYLTTLRAEPELARVMKGAADSTNNADRALIEEFKQDNFGTLDSFAAPLSRSGYAISESTGKMEFKPSYSALAELSPEAFATQKIEGVKRALVHAAATGNTQLAGKLMSNYTNTAPHQRTPQMTELFSQVAGGYIQTKPGHIEIAQPDSNVVQQFAQSTGATAASKPEAAPITANQALEYLSTPSQKVVEGSVEDRITKVSASASQQGVAAKQRQVQEVIEVAQRRGVPINPAEVNVDNVSTFRTMLDLDKPAEPPEEGPATVRRRGTMGDFRNQVPPENEPGQTVNPESPPDDGGSS